MAQLLTYQETRVRLPKTGCPPRNRMWLIYQDTFGYLGGQDTSKVLGTAAAAVCIEIYLRDRKGNGLFTHLSPRMNQFQSLTDILSYAEAHGLTTPPYEQPKILTNLFASRNSVRRALYSLRVMGMDPQVLRCLPIFRNEILIDNTGVMQRTDMAVGFGCNGISEDEKRRVAGEMFGITKVLASNAVSGTRTLRFVNTGEEVFKPEPFSIYPGVPFLDVKDWRNEGKRKRYIIHVKVGDGFDPKVLDLIPPLEGVKVAITRCAAGKYLEVGTRSLDVLNQEYIRNAQTTAMNIAAVMARQLSS